MGQRRDAPVGYHDELNIGPCVLVSREMGSGGSQIASQVAQRLGWEILDKEILDKLASQYGTPRVVLDAVDEKKVGWLLDLFNGWIEGHGFSQLSYVNRLGHLFNTVAKRGNVVIVGRGAKFLLPKTAGFSVRVVAPLDFRVEQVILRQGVSAAEARGLIEESDNGRQAFIETFFHQNVADPHVHDLVINIKQLSQSDAVNLIVSAVKLWLIRSGFEAPNAELRTLSASTFRSAS
jgi:cytidylate kinase